MIALPSRFWRPLANIAAAAMTLLAIMWALNVPRMLGVGFYPQQFLGLILAIALFVAFLSLPVRPGTKRETVPWWDVVFALISAAAALWVALRYPTLTNRIFMHPPEIWIPGGLLVLALLETVRRATGWTLPIILVSFLAYALLADRFPGGLEGRPQGWQQLAAYMSFDSNGVLGLPLSVAATVVVAFIFFGVVLNIAGGSVFFTDAAMRLMGRYRGGSMKISVIASALFGSISGSAVANVASTGVITIPMIKRDGYPAHKAAAIEAVASTGGQLTPPVMGAAAFLMAEFLAVPYSTVVIAAIVPAVLYYVAVFVQADLEAARMGILAVPRDQIPPRRKVMSGLHFLLGFGVLIYALFFMNWQPERAALLAAAMIVATVLIFGYDGTRPGLKTLLSSFAGAGHAVVEIILISAASGIVIGVLNVTGLSFNLTYLLVQIGGDSLILLLVLSAAVCVVLGMGLPTLGVYVLLAALVAPALTKLGIEPIAAHLYVLYFGMMSMITPPIALAAFAGAAIAKAPAMATGFAAMRFGWLAYVIPFLFVFSPALLLDGSRVEVAVVCVTAIAGVIFVSAALAGYFATILPMPTRLLLGSAGLLSLFPFQSFEVPLAVSLVGPLLGGAILVHDHRRKPKAEPSGVATQR